MGRMDNKIAFITGAARGQGRAHALRLAGEGADIIATDIAGPVDTVGYEAATAQDLAETVRAVEALGRRAVSFTADVRDFNTLQAGLDAAVGELGGLDVLVANAGILNDVRNSWQLDEAQWQTMIDVNLGGVWHSTKAAIPHIIDRGPGGSLILISSTGGLRGIPGISHYNAAKHGVTGLARTLANELSPHRIRVNSIHPTNVRTQMIDNPSSARIYCPDLESPTLEDAMPTLARINMWDVPYVDTDDVANAVLFLACEESRYITGTALPVDLGMSMKFSGA
ncbi:mycofactocin-coupled SDR family oxidoreductase [Saccharopolyspora mangrovi]|uniref:Mycofactocin-coupled SDR family oxidoreductase n=1 Tax=Saccharopolyspora mangrovi TaxID=3082379 RepID=A0ABU6AJP5_9PSEU|nr:mycofactocin-coupled SDR family oxidoreductase [Saccharopolyspora sp. S2-29]MEB3371736.1 mycofactocin-coupled SDR family oxidoreductase [Saccharopolyspora sp. S2-29]